MREIETRMPCPVCLGVMMRKARVGTNAQVELDYCPRCGGVWFEQGEVQRLRETCAPDALWAQLERRETIGAAQCHACHAHIERDADTCAACGRETRFDCPCCERTMRRVRTAGLALDVCEHCKGVWFDDHELAAVWQASLGTALAQRGRGKLSIDGDDDALMLTSALFYAPDLVFFGGYAAAQVIAESAQGLAHAPEAIAGAADVAAEAAASVFEVIVEIVAGIFG